MFVYTISDIIGGLVVALFLIWFVYQIYWNRPSK